MGWGIRGRPSTFVAVAVLALASAWVGLASGSPAASLGSREGMAQAGAGDPPLESPGTCEREAGAAARVIDLHPYPYAGRVTLPVGSRVLVHTQWYQRTFTIPTVGGGPGAGAVLRRICAARQGYLDEAAFVVARIGEVTVNTATNDCGACAAFVPFAYVRAVGVPAAHLVRSPLDLLARLHAAHVNCSPILDADEYPLGAVQVHCATRPRSTGNVLVTLRVYDGPATKRSDLAALAARHGVVLVGPNWSALPNPDVPVLTLQIALGGTIRD